MKTHATADTSRDAYRGFIAEGRLEPMQQRIVDFLASHAGDYTRRELALYTGIGISSVCGRVKELLEAGSIVEKSRRPCSQTGIAAHALAIAPVQRALFA